MVSVGGVALPVHCSLSATLTMSRVTEHFVDGVSELKLENTKEMARSVPENHYHGNVDSNSTFSDLEVQAKGSLE